MGFAQSLRAAAQKCHIAPTDTITSLTSRLFGILPSTSIVKSSHIHQSLSPAMDIHREGEGGLPRIDPR